MHLDVVFDEVAEYTRRFLRHREFRTHTQRLGKIARVRPSGVSYWEVHRRGEHALSW